jgi:hypothetical protein
VNSLFDKKIASGTREHQEIFPEKYPKFRMQEEWIPKEGGARKTDGSEEHESFMKIRAPTPPDGKPVQEYKVHHVTEWKYHLPIVSGVSFPGMKSGHDNRDRYIDDGDNDPERDACSA